MVVRIYRFDADAGRAVLAYGSSGLTVTHVLRAAAQWHVVAIHLEPGGVVAAHPAAADQLFLVVAGSGAFKGGEGTMEDAFPGCAAFWAGGEVHETQAGPEGLTAIVLEGDGLEAAIALPLWEDGA